MITIIFKAIEKCNSNCIYCGVIKGKQHEVMKYDLLKEVFQKMNDYLLKYPDETISFIWHGGEVCLLGAEYFFKAIELLNTCCETTKRRIKHSVQSNLTLINQDIVDAFKILGIKSVGSSYEFMPHIRGFGKNRDSVAYNKKFFEGVNLLEKNGMRWGVIYVVHKQSLQNPAAVFYTLTNLNVANSVKLNKIYIYGEDPYHLAITSREYADFLGAIFPLWWENRERFSRVTPFSEFYESYTGNSIQVCCELAGQCSHHWLYMGPTGNVSQCGRAGDFGILPYGNIRNQTFEEVLHNPQREVLKNRVTFLRQTACKDCRFWMVCNGGCPLDAILVNKEINTKAPHCEWVTHFLTHYFEPITQLSITNYELRITN